MCRIVIGHDEFTDYTSTCGQLNLDLLHGAIAKRRLYLDCIGTRTYNMLTIICRVNA